MITVALLKQMINDDVVASLAVKEWLKQFNDRDEIELKVNQRSCLGITSFTF